MTISPPRSVTLRVRGSAQELPSAFRIRSEMNGIAEAPGKVWFWELAAAVIDADRCVQCGACVAACPTDSIGIGTDDLPRLIKMCTGCSLCWDFCPRGGLRYEATWLRDGASTAPAAPPSNAVDWRITGEDPAPGLGLVRRQFAARVRPMSPLRSAGAQDGGFVSAILLAALEAGEIDGAVVAAEDPRHPWKGIPKLATSADEIRAAAGSFYNQTMALSALDLGAAGLDQASRIALVGTPCEIAGLRALQARSWRRGTSAVDAVVLTIALLCTKSFDYRKLMLRLLRDERGLDLAQVGKVDVIHGRMIVEDRDGGVVVDEPVKDFHGAALKGCDECADFLGRAADISVGSVGSDTGWSSVLVRTPTGERALDLVLAHIETGDLARPEALAKLDTFDKKTAQRAMQRALDPDGPLFIDYEEHVAFYAGTDRAPVWK
jgi:coenzyme F420 hydrogenase subunit beta